MRFPLYEPARIHRLLAAAALVAALWGVRAELPAGFTLHFLGAALLYLMFGAPLALAGMGVAAALACALGGGDWAPKVTTAVINAAIGIEIRALTASVARRSVQ